MSNTSMRAAILVVCTANVCRSPLAAYGLAEVFASTPGFESVGVASAGIDALRDGRICELVASTRDSEEWADFAAAHRPRPVTQSRIEQAELILTASLGSRAAVAKLDPSARSRTFTLLEALWLGEGFEPGDATGVSAVEAFAEYANSRRGRKPLPSPRGRVPWRRSKDDALSIPDGHNLDARQHRETVAAVGEASENLARLITGTRPDRAAERRERWSLF